jgi:hypothetical protein
LAYLDQQLKRSRPNPLSSAARLVWQLACSPLPCPSCPLSGATFLGELLERDTLDLDALAVPGIAPPDHFVNEAAIGSEILELARAAQQ